MSETWILGASGRSGRAIAAELAARHMPMVLLGRNASALDDLAKTLDAEVRVVVASTVGGIAEELANSKASVVVNAIGPFTQTALPIARACAPGTHYVDIGNELPAFLALFGLHDEAVSAGRCIVPGAGWGVLATESVVLKLCEGQPPASRVRVDSMASVNSPGSLGPTLAATIMDGLTYGGRRYEGGMLKRVSPGGDRERLTLPDGRVVKTGSVPFGELEAARRASGALDVVSGFPQVVPPMVGAVMPAIAVLLSIPSVRAFATRRLARVEIPASTRNVSWAHARVAWQGGTVGEGWLRAGDAHLFLARAVAEVAVRLVRGEGRPGTFTPGAMFGANLAVAAGGEFVLDPAWA